MTSFLLRPIPLGPAAITFSQSAVAGFPASNLLTPQPKEVYKLIVGNEAWGVRFDIDLGADTLLDTAALLFHSGINGFWRMYSRTAAQGPYGAPPAGESDATLAFGPTSWRTAPSPSATRFHGLWIGAQLTGRYLRFIFQSPGNDPAWSAGIVAVGKQWQPADPHDWGSGRRIADLSDVRIMDGGERGIWRKARVPEVRFSYSQMSEAELQTLYEMMLQVGESDPLLFGENWTGTGAGQQERIHYGTLAGLDFYERRQTEKSRIDLRLKHWL